MTALLFILLWVFAAVGTLGAYCFGVCVGRAYVSDRTFGPVAAGLVAPTVEDVARGTLRRDCHQPPSPRSSP